MSRYQCKHVCLHALIWFFLKFCKVALNSFHPEMHFRWEAAVLASRHSDYHHLSMFLLLPLSLNAVMFPLLCSLHISSYPLCTIDVLVFSFLWSLRWIREKKNNPSYCVKQSSGHLSKTHKTDSVVHRYWGNEILYFNLKWNQWIITEEIEIWWFIWCSCWVATLYNWICSIHPITVKRFFPVRLPWVCNK